MLLSQTGKATDYLLIASIDSQKIFIDVEFQAATFLANRSRTAPWIGGLTDLRLMYASTVKCPMRVSKVSLPSGGRA